MESWFHIRKIYIIHHVKKPKRKKMTILSRHRKKTFDITQYPLLHLIYVLIWGELIFYYIELSHPVTGPFFYVLFYGFFNFYIWFEREGKGWRKRGREISTWERNIDWLPSIWAPTEDRTCNWGMCPDQELNQQPFNLWNDTQATEPHQPGFVLCFLININSQNPRYQRTLPQKDITYEKPRFW